MTWTVEPVDDDRAASVRVLQNGVPRFYAIPGGTGACWNIGDIQHEGDPDEVPLHVCELDDIIEALQALRASDAHRRNEERWA